MVVVGDYVVFGVAMSYAANGSDKLVRLSIRGGTPAVLVDDVPGFVDGLVVVGGNIIYGAGGLTTGGDHDGSIRSVPIAGGATTMLVSGVSTLWPGGIATDGLSVYWADKDGVHDAPVAGGSARTITTQSVLMVARVGDNLILDDKSGGNLLSIPVGGGMTMTLVTGRVNPIDVQGCGGGSLCWSDEGALTGAAALSGQGAAIMKRDATAQLHVLLAPGVRSDQLVFDGEDLFSYTGDGTGSIMRIPLDGNPAVVITNSAGGWPIAVDDQCVYWAEVGGGILSVNKTVTGPV